MGACLSNASAFERTGLSACIFPSVSKLTDGKYTAAIPCAFRRFSAEPKSVGVRETKSRRARRASKPRPVPPCRAGNRELRFAVILGPPWPGILHLQAVY